MVEDWMVEEFLQLAWAQSNSPSSWDSSVTRSGQVVVPNPAWHHKPHCHSRKSETSDLIARSSPLQFQSVNTAQFRNDWFFLWQHRLFSSPHSGLYRTHVPYKQPEALRLNRRSHIRTPVGAI